MHAPPPCPRRPCCSSPAWPPAPVLIPGNPAPNNGSMVRRRATHGRLRLHKAAGRAELAWVSLLRWRLYLMRLTWYRLGSGQTGYAASAKPGCCAPGMQLSLSNDPIVMALGGEGAPGRLSTLLGRASSLPQPALHAGPAACACRPGPSSRPTPPRPPPLTPAWPRPCTTPPPAGAPSTRPACPVINLSSLGLNESARCPHAA